MDQVVVGWEQKEGKNANFDGEPRGPYITIPKTFLNMSGGRSHMYSDSKYVLSPGARGAYLDGKLLTTTRFKG